jgi:RND family efflux transporter MFP subunit
MKSSVVLWIAGLAAGLPAGAADLATYTVGARAAGAAYAATGTIEAVRQGTLGAQVSGRVTEVLVRNGDAVRAGQPLLRIEPGDALDTVSAASAAAAGAEARLTSARADYERAQQLRAKDYLSIAAMQRAEAALRSAEAEARATSAQASAARTRAGWHTVTAPYAGHVMELWVTPGDLATPGRPLLALYDPAALRVVAQVPESLAGRLQQAEPAVMIPRSTARVAAPVTLTAWRAVPAIDPVTHSVEVRAELPAGTTLEPGQFVSLHLPLQAVGTEVRVPRSAVLRRSEVTGVYVVDDKGTARLRQVRLGPPVGDEVLVLSGLQGGEQVALDPVAAARQ